MKYYFDKYGFLTDSANAIGSTEVVPPIEALNDGYKLNFIYTRWVAIPESAHSQSKEEVELYTINKLKSYKLKAIKEERDARILTSVQALGTEFQADEHSTSLLHEAITLASIGLPLPPVWRDSFNNNVVITSIDQLKEIAAAITSNKLEAYQVSWARKEALVNATTIEEIDAV